MNIRFGACTSIDSANILSDAGFDYIELGLSPIAQLSSTDFKALKKKVSKAPIKPEVFNLFLPKEIRLVGPERSDTAIFDYLTDALGKASELGGQLVVFGSGGARRIPDGYNRGDALKELADFCNKAGKEAAKHKITIAIEPLRKAECNAVNGTAQGLALAAAANQKNVTVLIDYYHMAQDGESPLCVLDAGSALTHVHIANGTDRSWPKSTSEMPYEPFFAHLDAIGYEGRISVEGRTDNIEMDAPTALSVLRLLANHGE